MPEEPAVVTVSLNPAIDRIVEVPGFGLGRHQRGRLISRTPAGKGVNVSRALARLGRPSVATGFVGSAEVELYEQFLKQRNIQPQLLSLDARTRENITIIDPRINQETHIREPGFDVGPADAQRLRRKLHLVARKGDIVVFAGSLPPGVTDADFAGMIRVCLDAGARVAVDTSGSPLRIAAGLPLWLIKPNTTELAEIVSRPLATDEEIIQAGRELSKTVYTVVVSRGEKGGYCFVDGSALAGHVPVDPSRLRSTVGCGDCLLAGFIDGRLTGHDIRESYRRALAVASAAAVTIEPGTFNRDHVREFLEAAVIGAVRNSG